ncbi:MAG TPA: poly(3-hydroxyalkanoate) depolymerase [Piscinibacter sp.]|jgi:poly(3-hydroxyalkanoate) depolymerase|nr:poly(3-hydroxyalkanoate) depolymerase [Piscinibacter sp.]
MEAAPGQGMRGHQPAEHANRPGEPAFAIQMLKVRSQLLRVGRQPGSGGGVPLLMFNGIGGSIELLEPLARSMPAREVIVFDVPGVGHSPMPRLPYRLRTLARWAEGVLDHYGHAQADVLGVSWGGAAAQEFARFASARCRRLILCATATGMLMVPGHPKAIAKMVTPRRYMSKDHAIKISGDIYGGDFRHRPELAADFMKHVKWQSRWGYYLQIAAATGWTSAHWLSRLKQRTLVMAGRDDPLIHMFNARLMRLLIPNSELKVFDCGHLFLMTRPDESVRAINEFLDKP